MWFIVSMATAVVWGLFYVKSRPLARAVDRGEVAVLKPLSITYLLLAIAFGVTGTWVPAAASAVAWFLNGAIGASLHRTRTFRELARGTMTNMEMGPGAELSHEESYTLARATMVASAVAGILLLVVLLQVHVRWYLAVPAAAVFAYLLMILWVFITAYRPKRDDAGGGAGRSN